VVRHVLLVDLEVYDDPRQGAGSWLFPDEQPLLDQLGDQLQTIGSAALDNDGWGRIVKTATDLRARVEANGVGRPVRNVR
jgi:hypothetical protein